MRYPEFREAEFSTTDMPICNRFSHYLRVVRNLVIRLILFASSGILTYWFFSIVFCEITSGIYLNVLSVGASLVTIFSAIISVLSLLDTNIIKKYEDDLALLESRYLNGRKISGWEFLRRYSHNPSNKYNYYISSACYKLYYGDTEVESMEIVIPALEVDFHDAPCVKQICRIKNFIPKFIDYIYEEQIKCNNNIDIGNELNIQPNYYIPLPNHIIALYKKILFHRITNNAMFLCLLFIINAILVSIVWMI